LYYKIAGHVRDLIEHPVSDAIPGNSVALVFHHDCKKPTMQLRTKTI